LSSEHNTSSGIAAVSRLGKTVAGRLAIGREV
jgi:hypothetical protein